LTVCASRSSTPECVTSAPFPRITASFTVDAPLGPNFAYSAVTPTSYTITDGVTTLSNTNSFLTSFGVATDPSGVISNWVFDAGSYQYVGGAYPGLQTSTGADVSSPPLANWNSDNPGKWTTGLSVTPSAMNFQVPQGAAAQSQSLQVGGAPATAWQATAATFTGGGWLSVSPAAGQVPASLAVLVNPGGLAAGFYQGSIAIQAPGAAASTVAVTLGVAAPGGQSTPNQVIVTVAGTGTPGALACSSGPCGPAFNIDMFNPAGLGFDDAGNLYIGQDGSGISGYPSELFKVAPNGVITPLYGGFVSIGGLQVLGAGSIDVTDYVAEAVIQVTPGTTPGGTVGQRVAGIIFMGFAGDGGPAANARFYYPMGVVVDQAGNLYISDSRNNRIRWVDSKGIINTIAGTSPTCLAECGSFFGDNGPAVSAQLNNPTGLAMTPDGDLYIADSQNGRVRKISPAGPNGIITTVAGNGVFNSTGGNPSGIAVDASLQGPQAVALDQNGNLYIADGNRILKVTVSGVIATVAGNGTAGYSGDGGPPSKALVNGPRALALDATGNLYFADAQNNRVRMIVTALGGIQNGASYATGAVSPGEIVVLYGAGMGPAVLAMWQVDSASGLLQTTVAGTTVLFNGVPAPILYTSADQVSVMVPYEVAGAATAQILVNFRGNNVAGGLVTVTSSAPAIFTVGPGTGQAAALNQDGSVNSASNPAAAGSTIVLYLTGEGQTTPPGVDGKIASAAPYPAPVLPVTVTIGGQKATASYAGAAPSEVAGVMQINAIIPTGVTGNAVPVSVQIGTASTQGGVTIAVQ
jgi:uncharacterized protein (TIGR03437 family)